MNNPLTPVRKKHIVGLLCGFILGFPMGYSIAWAEATGWCAGVALKLAQGVGLNIDAKSLQEMVDIFLKMKDSGII